MGTTTAKATPIGLSSMTIKPAEIPSGDELTMGISYPADGKESGPFTFAVGLVPQGAALTCSDPVKFGATK
jgi:hypothetical protein